MRYFGSAFRCVYQNLLAPEGWANFGHFPCFLFFSIFAIFHWEKTILGKTMWPLFGGHDFFRCARSRWISPYFREFLEINPQYYVELCLQRKNRGWSRAFIKLNNFTYGTGSISELNVVHLLVLPENRFRHTLISGDCSVGSLHPSALPGWWMTKAKDGRKKRKRKANNAWRQCGTTC